MKKPKGRVHTIYTVLNRLRFKKDVRIDNIHNGAVMEPTVIIRVGPRRENDLGNKSHGMIDYLTNHCGFKRLLVSEF